MTVPMERVENRILSIRGHRRQGFLGANLGVDATAKRTYT